MTKTQAQAVSKLLESIEIDVSPEDLEAVDSYDSLTDFLQDNGYFDVEIIYYARAIEYLSEHDQSLQESLNLAHEMGYTADNLSSEILASLLASENVREDYYDLHDEINEILE